jgi:hypothetical protein
MQQVVAFYTEHHRFPSSGAHQFPPSLFAVLEISQLPHVVDFKVAVLFAAILALSRGHPSQYFRLRRVCVCIG